MPIKLKTADAVALAAGVVLVSAFFGLDATSSGLDVRFAVALTASSPGELNFWLGQVLLLCPGMLLIGIGAGEHLLPLLRRVASRIEATSKAERYVGLITLTLLSLSAARVARSFFLLDMPMSDDELAVEFGGRVLASGNVFAHLQLPPITVPSLFLLVQDGGFASFDWPGGQVLAAAAALTKLDALLWAAVAAIPVAAIAAAVGVRLGAGWGLVAALAFVCSPMAGLMSMTTHSQLVSRMFFGLALLAFSLAEKHDRPRHWLLTGLFFGFTFFCRPPEAVFLTAPIVGWVAFRALRGIPGSRVALVAMTVGALPGALLLMAHSWAVTGNPFLPARFASPDHVDIVFDSLWGRFGNNFSYNILMLAIWFLGPLGLALTAAGASVDRFTWLLTATVCSALALTMLHDNSGLHIVGPIHYSECAVPLSIVATFGMRKIIACCSQRTLAPSAGALFFIIVFGLPVFTAMQGFALRQQAEVQKIIFAAIDRSVRHPEHGGAVVLAPNFHAIWSAYPPLAAIGTWVYDWPRPQLDLSDDILYLRDVEPAISELRRLLPDRRFYRLRPLREPPYVMVIPLDGGAPHPLIGMSHTAPKINPQNK